MSTDGFGLMDKVIGSKKHQPSSQSFDLRRWNSGAREIYFLSLSYYIHIIIYILLLFYSLSWFFTIHIVIALKAISRMRHCAASLGFS